MQRGYLLLILLVACGSSGGTTSLVQIIESPQDFTGRHVMVQGYLAFGGGRPSMMLYLTEEQARTYDTASGIAVFDPTPDEYVTRKCSKARVVVVGTVQRIPGSGRFARSVVAFAIDNVVRVVKFAADSGESHICWEAPPDV